MIDIKFNLQLVALAVPAETPSMSSNAVATADIGAIKALRRALHRLMQAQGALDNEYKNVWPEKPTTYLLTQSPRDKVSDTRASLMTYLDELKGQQELLAQLQVVLETRIHLLELQLEELEQRLELEKPHCSITRLPLDVLRTIFNFCVESEAALPREQISLNSVCRHFRTAALKTPGLWTFISSDMSSERLNTQFCRAETYNLNVRILSAPFSASTNERQRHRDAVEQMLLHSSRWAHLEVVGGIDVISDIQAFPYLPSLRSMTLGALPTTPESSSAVLPGLQKFPNWTTPVLHSVSSINFSPPLYFSSSLVTCSLTWIGKFTPSPGQLVYSLSQSSQLQSLTLKTAIDIYDKSLEVRELVSVPVRATLSHLHKLTIVMQGSHTQTACLRILSQISAPKLRVLTMELLGPLLHPARTYQETSVHYLQEKDAIQNLLRLPKALDVFPELEVLDFRCNYFQPKQFDCIGELVLKMPALRELRFDAPYLPPPWSLHQRDIEMGMQSLTRQESQPLPNWHAPIERLEIRNNLTTTPAYLLELADIIMSIPEASQTFRSLSVIGCLLISADDVRWLGSRLHGKEVPIETKDKSFLGSVQRRVN